MADFYEVLGVHKNASDKEIRQAYRKLARQYHPDVNKTDASAEERFKEINEAYSVLSDEESRKKYDLYGENWRHAEDGGTPPGGQRPRRTYTWTSDNSDYDDIFANFAGRNRSPFGGFDNAGPSFEGFFGASERQVRRPSPEHPVEVTLEEAFHGATRTLRLTDGRTLEVKIPAGVDDGSRVHIASGGATGGDLYLKVSVLEHATFRRDGRDLYTEIDLDVDDAVLGSEIVAPTLTGKVALTVPPLTPQRTPLSPFWARHASAVGYGKSGRSFRDG